MTVLMVTHDLPYALELCPRVGDPRRAAGSSPTGPPRDLLADADLLAGTGWSCRSDTVTA